MPRWLHWPKIQIFDNTFTYCAFSNAQLTIFRPVDNFNGNFIYCAFDLNNSGFDRTP